MADDRPLAEQLQAPIGSLGMFQGTSKEVPLIPDVMERRDASEYEYSPSASTSSSSNFEFQQMAAALEDKMTLTFRNEMNEMKNMMKALVPTPTPIKAVEERSPNLGKPNKTTGLNQANNNRNVIANQGYHRTGNNGKQSYDGPLPLMPPPYVNPGQEGNGKKTEETKDQVQPISSLNDEEGDVTYLEKLLEVLNDDPFSPITPFEFKKEVKNVESVKTSIEEPPDLELKELPSHLEYAFLEKDNKLPVIISKDLKDDEKVKLIEVLKAHKSALAWKISDIKGIDPKFCTHKILMEDDYKPVVQMQRRVNPKIHEVIKKEVIKLLDAGLIYPISDSPWVSPVHCVPKKGGMTVVMNDDNELIPTRLVTGWRVCIDYRKLNDATRKDHFPLLS
ncbi:hypothetical protein Tco_0755984 [Tanacetum coccineum]